MPGWPRRRLLPVTVSAQRGEQPKVSGMWDGNGGHPLMVAVSCQYRSIRGSVVTSAGDQLLAVHRVDPRGGLQMRFSTTHEQPRKPISEILPATCNVTLIVIKKRSGGRHMRIAVAGGMSRSAWAGAATTARSDDLEFLAIRRVAPAGPRPPVPASAGWPQAESVRARARRLRAFASLPIVDVRRLARDERADFAAFLATLSPQQWQAPTLCTRWRVRDVVAHVISYDELDARGLLAHVVRGRFRPDQVNAAALVGYDTRTPGQLLALLTDHLQPRGLPAALGGRVALVEALIHHQDIRRPLGLPRAIPPERLLPALRTALIAPDIGGLWRIRGVRLVATDLGFSAGAGPEVRGTAEALLMTIAGRRDVMSELSGPGQRKFAGRLHS